MIKDLDTVKGKRRVTRLSSFHYSLPVFLALIIGFPTLQLPYTLINDGVTIENYYGVINSIQEGNWSEVGKRLLGSKYHGRFFPTYHIFNNLSLWLFGESVKTQRLIHILKFVIIFLSLYIIVYKITARKYIAFLSILPFAFCSSFYIKWSLIGAPEAGILMVLSVSLLLYNISGDGTSLFHRASFAASIGCLPFIYFYKEVAIAIIPSILILLLLYYRFHGEVIIRRRALIYPISNLLVCLSYFVIRFLLGYFIESGDYSKSYVIQFPQILSVSLNNLDFYLHSLYNTFSVFLLLPFLVWGYYLFRFFSSNKGYKDLSDSDIDNLIWSTFSVSFFLFTLGIHLPWKNANANYLILSVYGFTLLFGLSLNLLIRSLTIINFRPPFKYVMKAVLVGLTLLFFFRVVVYNGFKMFNSAQYQKVRDTLYHEAILFLAEITPAGGKVWTTIPPIEPLYEAQKHLEVFHGRSDVNVRGLDLDVESGPEIGDIVAIVKPYPKTQIATSGIWHLWELNRDKHLDYLKSIKKSGIILKSQTPFELFCNFVSPPSDHYHQKRKRLIFETLTKHCDFYKVRKPLRFAEIIPNYYRFEKGRKPALSNGFWKDGWLSVDNSITLNVPEKLSGVILRGLIPFWAGYSFPYRFTLKADFGWQKLVEIPRSGEFEWSQPIREGLFFLLFLGFD
jgi:hypothetical protein